MIRQPKRFVSVTTEVLNNKLVIINTSADRSLVNENGIDFLQAIEFLFNLVYLRSKKETTVFVSYAFARDNEFLFSTAPEWIRDRLFQSDRVRGRVDELETENEDFDAVLFEGNILSLDYHKANFQKTINRHILSELTSVTVDGYDIELINGKMLRIKRGKKIVTIYDIYGFFKPQSLRAAVRLWFQKDLALLDRKLLDKALVNIPVIDRLKCHALLETSAIQSLATALHTELVKRDINLSRWHGATAVSSHWLGRVGAKQEFYNYRFRRQYAPELWKAVRQANYGGRAEQFKLGTIQNVYVYDINSAYGHAVTLLPKMLRKPQYCTKYAAQPFSLWFVDYDLRDVPAVYIGPFPNRDFGAAVKYKLKGKGYFWQPEIEAALAKYGSEHIKIGHGFVLPYEQADFAKGVQALYEMRLELKRQGSPLEKVIKLALASLYGKFAQSIGHGHYYNQFYAGFITSFVRARLLEAVNGYENQTICFQTDAIHSTCGNLNVSYSDDIGDYKRDSYAIVSYIDNGVYRCFNGDGRVIKEKTRGLTNFEFEQALQEFQNERIYTALSEFFVGHNLYVKDMFRGAKYLDQYRLQKQVNPLERSRSAMRLFEFFDTPDAATTYFDSRPLSNWSGLESGVKRKSLYALSDTAIETIRARG